MTTVNMRFFKNGTRVLLPGDENPTDFNFNLQLSDEQRLTLYERNGVLQIPTDWYVTEALRNRFTMEKDQPMVGLKHNKPYTFTAKPAETQMDPMTGIESESKPGQQAILRYLEWIRYFVKTNECMTWSELFGDCIIVLWDDQEGIKDHNWEMDSGETKKLDQGLYFKPNPNPQAYIDFDAYYRVTYGNGYSIVDSDENGNPLLYAIHTMRKGMRRATVTYVHADRVIVWRAKRSRLSWSGKSKCEGLDLLALGMEQMTNKTVSRANKLAGAILAVYGVSGSEEADAIDATIGDDLTSLDRGYFMDKNKDGMEYVTPDLKAAGEFQALFEVMSTVIARHLRISKLLFDGEQQTGFGNGGEGILTSYTPILGLQQHYKRNHEELLYALGVNETSFEWNPIIPEKPNDFQIGFQNNKIPGKDNEEDNGGSDNKDSDKTDE